MSVLKLKKLKITCQQLKYNKRLKQRGLWPLDSQQVARRLGVR